MARPAPTLTSSPLAAEVDNALTVLSDSSFTAEGVAKSVIKQIAEMQFPTPERESLMKSELVQFAQRVRDLRLDDNTRNLRRAAAELLKTPVALAQPVPSPKPADIVRSYRLVANYGWPFQIVDFLVDHLEADDFSLGAADAKGITTATRRITIDELVIFNRPRSMTDDHFPRWRASVMAPSLGQSRPADEN